MVAQPIEFSRHAKRRCRLYKVTEAEVRAAFPQSRHVDTDKDGRRILEMQIRHILIRAVMAVDEPNLIVTLYERKK